MNTGIEIKMYTFMYTLEKSLKSYNTYTFNCEISTLYNKLTDTIRIENFRGYSNGKGFDKYLRLRDTSNWNDCEKVTGVKPFKQNVFYGDRVKEGKKSLIVFVFTNGVNNLQIDYYDNFYPHKAIELQSILNTYLNK